MHLLNDAMLAAVLHAAESGQIPTPFGHLTTSRPLQPVHLLYARDVCKPAIFVADIQRGVAERHLTARGYSLMARAAEPVFLHLTGSGPRDAWDSHASARESAAHVTP